MQIVAVSSNSDKAPTTGTAMYVVVDEGTRHLTLLHPVTLSKFELTIADYRSGLQGEYWPSPSTGMEKFAHTRNGESLNVAVAALLERQRKNFVEMKRQFPEQLVRRAIAALRGIPVEKVPIVKEPSSTPRGFAVRSEKRPGVVDAIAEMLIKGVTIDEAVAELKKMFPDRNAEGMRTTVRCQINRLPAKLGRTLVAEFNKKRGGKVFQFAK